MLKLLTSFSPPARKLGILEIAPLFCTVIIKVPSEDSSLVYLSGTLYKGKAHRTYKLLINEKYKTNFACSRADFSNPNKIVFKEEEYKKNWWIVTDNI